MMYTKYSHPRQGQDNKQQFGCSNLVSISYQVFIKMRVEKREFVWEFSQLSCLGQNRMRVDESWEARVCMRVFSTIMSWSNEDESWWELRSESLYERFLNYHVLVKQGWELMRVEKRELVWEFSQLSISWSKEDESWWALRSESLYKSFLNCHFLVKRGWELMRVEKR